jgi:hypothetical protein
MLASFKELFRTIDDWLHEQIKRKRCRILFVVCDGHGFASQAPVIQILRKYKYIDTCITTDRDFLPKDMTFLSDSDRQLFGELYVQYKKALLMKWDMYVNTHLNPFRPKRHALKVFMNHGTAYGNTGTMLPNAQGHDVFLGISCAQKNFFEMLEPGIFDTKRAFFPVGSTKADALVNGTYDRGEVLSTLGLPDRPTILITSHWAPHSTLSILGSQVMEEVSRSFPEYNVIQTGHPYLWTPNKNVDSAWSDQLVKDLRSVEETNKNAFFIYNLPVQFLLSISDLLIADQSSVMTMYSLLDRPIVFFDNPESRRKKIGKEQIMDLYIGASHTFPDISKLSSACIEAINNPNKYKRGRALLRDEFFSNLGKSSPVAAEVLSKICGVYSVKSRSWHNVIELSRQMTTAICSQPLEK